MVKTIKIRKRYEPAVKPKKTNVSGNGATTVYWESLKQKRGGFAPQGSAMLKKEVNEIRKSLKPKRKR